MTILESYIKNLAKQINESEGIVDEATKDGKYYDWSEDFVFTQDVISDLKKRDLLGIKESGGIYVMVPVNRENAPEYYDRKYHNMDDYEPYNILHISILVDALKKTINIERWYGHRLDWNEENSTNTEQDWTVIPVLSKKTVLSLIEMYNDNDVFEKLIDSIIRHTKEHEDYLDRKYGNEEKLRDYYQHDLNYDKETVDKKVEKLIFDKNATRTKSLTIVENCIAITDGDYKNFKWEWDYSEIPTKSEIEDRYETHKEKASDTEKRLADYYDNNSYTGY